MTPSFFSLLRRFRCFTIIALLFFSGGSDALFGKEPPAGILITKSAPADLRVGSVIEYRAVTEHLVPVTDYVTLTKPDGDRDDIPKNMILLKVEYPKELPRNLLTPAALGEITGLLQQLRGVVTKYPQAQKYLEPKIANLQKEVDLFNLGSRKINGTWVSSADFIRMRAEEEARMASVVEAKKRAEVELAAAKQREQEAAAEAKRLAEEKSQMEKREAEEKSALEAKAKAELLLKKQKKEAAGIEKPHESIASSLTYYTWVFAAGLLLFGGGVFVWLRTLKGKSAVPGLETLEWPDFELLIAEIYRRKGYMVEISSGFGSEGGRDLVFKQGDSTLLVECKHWKVLKDYKISAPEIMGLYQWVMSEPGQHGLFITSGEFMDETKAFVEGKPIQLMGMTEIKNLFSQVKRPKEDLLDIKSWVDEFIAHSTVTDPVCPKCQQPMELIDPASDKPMWICSDNLRCNGKINARVNLIQKRGR